MDSTELRTLILQTYVIEMLHCEIPRKYKNMHQMMNSLRSNVTNQARLCTKKRFQML